ncbi:MAG: hypothetical protein HPY71_13700 [Firmicutes bacterium]|nr:hypothetical protein [Bacillota bacterium]
MANAFQVIPHPQPVAMGRGSDVPHHLPERIQVAVNSSEVDVTDGDNSDYGGAGGDGNGL